MEDIRNDMNWYCWG